MLRIMFICTGNICRSAMAHAYLEYKLERLGLQDKVLVASSGTSAVDGEDATALAKSSIAKYGASLGAHKAKNIRQFNLDEFDYILVMTNEHEDFVYKNYPNVSGKVQLLKEYQSGKNNGYMNIDDPWGLSSGVYEDCAKTIVNCVDCLLTNIKKKVESR